MKTNNFVAVMLCCLAVGLGASAQVTVTGNVSDSVSRKGIYLVTVRLFPAKSPAAKSYSVATDPVGNYEFRRVPPGEYQLVFTHIGFREHASPLQLSTGDSLISVPGTLLSPEPKELKGIELKAIKQRLLVTQEDDRIVYHVDNDPGNLSLSALDILRKTPMITVDGEGGIRVNGQTNYKILLNGRETGLFTNNPQQVLKGFPGKLINRIEVITSPSAKYDAEGVHGLIDLITQKAIVGYNANLGVNYTRFSVIPFASLNLKYGKLGLTGSGGYNDAKNPRGSVFSEQTATQPVSYYKRSGSGVQESKSMNQWANLEIAYDLDTLSTASLYASLSGGLSRNEGLTDFTLVLPSVTDTVASSYAYRSTVNNPGVNWGADYVRKFKTNKNRALSFKYYAQYGTSNSSGSSSQWYVSRASYNVNANRSRDRQQTFQVDYTHPLPRSQRIETGLKGISRHARADYEHYFHDQRDATFKRVPANSNNFDYDQQVYSAYGSYRFSWLKMAFRFGARLERTRIEGGRELSTKEIHQHYTNILPNLFISRTLKNNQSLSVSYSDRLARPYITNLNPFVATIDSLNLSYGNPDLLPQVSHGIELAYSIFKGQSSFSARVSETFSHNQVLRYSLFDTATGIRRTTFGNIGLTSGTNLSVSANTSVNNTWYFSLNGGLQFLSLQNKENALQQNSGFALSGTLSTGFTFSERISTSAFLWYSQAPVTLQGNTSANYTLTWNGNYTLVKNKLSASLSLNNFLPSRFSNRSTVNDPAFSLFSETRTYRSAIGFSLNWNFGKLTEKVSKKTGVKNDDLLN